jgi:hypothetical protein
VTLATLQFSRESCPVTTFRQQFSETRTLVDERAGIGPHHLAIGKTRKLFEKDGTIFAFFSRGYEIACAMLEECSLQLRATQTLDIPVAWGGGAFCVDCDGTGRVALAFIHRNQHELCLVTGVVKGGCIEWEPWRSLLVSSASQAAPWLELGADGTVWCSVLDRSGDFRIAVVKDQNLRVGNLFTANEGAWYHSCVQVLPVAKDRAVAVGFRGSFPSKTELVFKTVSATLEMGSSEMLAPCNVNDKLTFHFQAAGDPARDCAHIVYLDEGLSVSHAEYAGGRWIVTKRIIPVASFAPQICINGAGDLLLLAADYEGQIWKATRPFRGDWSEPSILPNVVAPNVSALFAQTGYGTGGLISAARSESGRVPFLMAEIKDERTSTAALYASSIGGGAGVLAPQQTLAIKQKGGTIDTEIRLAGLGKHELKQPGNSWLVTIPAEKGRALKIRIAAGDTITASTSYVETDGKVSPLSAHATVRTSLCDGFSGEPHGTICAILDTDPEVSGLHTDCAWVETYSGGQLIDIAPFQPETAAKLALNPGLITRTYKRMV